MAAPSLFRWKGPPGDTPAAIARLRWDVAVSRERRWRGGPRYFYLGVTSVTVAELITLTVLEEYLAA